MRQTVYGIIIIFHRVQMVLDVDMDRPEGESRIIHRLEVRNGRAVIT